MTKKVKKYSKRSNLAVGVIFLVALSVGSFTILKTLDKPKAININDVKLKTEVANTDDSRKKGLSGRQSLAEDASMLFIFDDLADHGIWMKDMLFSIDIIWLDENKRVISLAENIDPESFPNIFRPDSDALYVIEANSGFIAENQIVTGDQAEF